MAITLADFNKIWASTSPLTPYSFSESNYKQGWNFIGSTPPARQMWDYLQKQNDEKMQFITKNYAPFDYPAMPEIPSGADLNTYITPGSYRCVSSSVAVSLVNAPYTGSNFTLLVIHGGNSAKYARQILFTTSDAVETTNLIYTRSCDGSGNNWTSWKRLAYAEDVLLLSGGTMTGDIQYKTSNNLSFKIKSTNSYVDVGWDCDNSNGGLISLRNVDYVANPGGFEIFAKDSSSLKILFGATDGTLTWDGQPLLPVGVVQAFAGSTIPTGWLLCDGSAVSRTTYANLFAVIGTTYGAGDESNTFNLPNLTDKFIEGSGTAGTEKTAGLPNITGETILAGTYIGDSSGNGAFRTNPESSTRPSGFNPADNTVQVDIDASRSSSVYGNSTTVQPPALTMMYIIKY